MLFQHMIPLMAYALDIQARLTDIWTALEHPYLKALVTFIVFFGLSKLVVWISQNIILVLTKKTKTQVDDLIVEKTNKHISWILLFFGLRLTLLPLPFPELAETIISRIFYSLISFVTALAILTIIQILFEHWGKAFTTRTKSTMDDHLLDLGYKTVRILMMIFAFLFILNLWDIKVGPLLTGLGIGGIAVAFALQPVLQNIFGGVMLILDKSVQVDDVVEIDTVSGKVLDVGIRSTKIKTWDNEVVIIPNSKLVDSNIKNVSKPNEHIRVVIPFGVAYGSDVQKVKKIVLELISKVDGVMNDPEPVVRFINMGSSSLDFKVYFHVDNLDKKWPAIDFVNTNIHYTFNKKGIEIPFPQMDVHMRK